MLDKEVVKDAEKQAEQMSEQFNALLSMPPKKFLAWLNANFYLKLPTYAVNSAEDMTNAAQLMTVLTNRYSYLCSFLSYAKIAVREAKRDGDKAAYEDMVDRRDSIDSMVSAVKQEYAAVSRAVTIHVENNEELKMVQ